MPDSKPATTIHIQGAALFLFIPLVLFLFLRFPLGVLPSFGLAIAIMILHRFVAIPFMNRNRGLRCLWCGRASRVRETMTVFAGKPVEFQTCLENCSSNARTFFDFVWRYKMLFRLGIFLPLAWYLVTMTLNELNVFHFPVSWNRFIFQFFIACTVVSISFLYRNGKETDQPQFAFPIHNLFLLGIRNTLIVFRIVGIWWILSNIYFLTTETRS